MTIKTHELISADEFLRRYAKDPKLVAGVRFVPAKLGERGLGMFKVKLKRPRYLLLGSSQCR